jgi:NAD(P)-dependent dehydrogenase (short-subunit alcohol dehydrogenase family)
MAMAGRFAGRAVLITGATGIGAASAGRIADEGGSVFVVSLEADDCEALGAGIEQCGWAAADLRDEQQAVAAVQQCVERFGRLDGALAVAGRSGRRFGDGPADEISGEAWDATLALNLTTGFLTAREAVRAMLEQEPGEDGTRGSIVLVSSVLAEHPAPELLATHAYAAAKGGLVSLARAMAARYAPDLIRVNALSPAFVTTPMSARAAGDPPTADYADRRQPLSGGFLPAEDVAAAAAFLLSADARYVTGQVLGVDGGWGVSG